ncbi:conserved protein of unknown function [Candidatus Bipolaricaulis anaerobius]|uniref:N-acetyltransferase domain-containing protein n=1 Tax=Candidatus Bipolaricaulis anaerobius TaxID=2026885 RepID=A0A2X3K5E3_9BACT|nr:conserved protein of unknown function [Candidatus Bipolaricaulis anaerobius]
MNRVDVRNMVPIDVQKVAVIAEQAFFQIYPFDWMANAEALAKASISQKATVLVAEIGEDIVGYCNLRKWPAGGWIDQIAVAQKNLRQGIGRTLVNHIISEARTKGYWKVSLITAESDVRSSRFFKACGFDVVGVMQDEIRKGENGILMSRIVDYSLHPNR